MNTARPRRPLSEADARAIISLLGDTVGIEDGPAAQRRFLMDGLCRLIEADSWAWAILCKFDSGEVPVSTGFFNGGFTAKEFGYFQQALEHPDTAILNAGITREFEEKQTHLTRRKEEIDQTDYFPDSDVFALWTAAGVEQVIMSVRPGAKSVHTIIGIYRRPGRPPFDERDSRMAHIILAEVPWLHEAGMPVDRRDDVIRLSGRERIVLHLLLEGQSRQQISEYLGVTYHTVDSYVKTIFRHFRAHSQPELIARFQTGDGGDEM